MFKRLKSTDPWRLRLFAGLTLLFSMPVLSREGWGWMFAATGLILAHVLIGVWVFVRHLKALSPLHQKMDLFAFLLMAGAVLAVDEPPVCAAFFAGTFAVALLKYGICLEGELPTGYQRYVREKIRLETPAVFLFAGAAVLSSRLPPEHFLQAGIERGIFLGALLFGVYLIAWRRCYPPCP